MMKKILSILLVLMLLPVCSLAEEWACPNCGSTDNTGNFCGDCGAAKPSETWVCGQCGTENQKDFCTNCGAPRTEQNATTGTTSYAVGDIVTFGSYEQDGDESNGTEPISWRVLDDYGDGTYLLLSVYGIEAKAYNDDDQMTTWADSTLRKWLNGEFYATAFTDVEKTKIQLTDVETEEPTIPGVEDDCGTQDYVYLLSPEEVQKYFKLENLEYDWYLGKSGDVICMPTQHAVDNGAGTESADWIKNNQPYYDYELREGACWWWLRCSIFNPSGAANVETDGKVSSEGIATIDSGCARPVVVARLTDENTDKPASETEIVTNTEHSVGDIVTFGSYEQDGDESNGAEPISWRVLDNYGDGTYLLLSEYGIEAKLYNEENEEVTWETCTLRSWLNEEFYETAFTDEEQAQIQLTDVKNADNPTYGTEGGNDTQDYVYLLSLDEIKKYFGVEAFNCSEELICMPTQHAVDNGAWTLSADWIKENQSNYSYERREGACRWRLRSSGFTSYCAAIVDSVGDVDSFGSFVYDNSECVRPVVVVRLTGENTAATAEETPAEETAETASVETYTADVATDFGTATLTVTAADGKITAVTYENVETITEPNFFVDQQEGLTMMLASMVDAQSAEVDGVSGATMSSDALKTAAAELIAQAMR